MPKGTIGKRLIRIKVIHMKIKKIATLLIICISIMLCVNITAFADEVQSISCIATANEYNVVISGQISNATESNQITLLVGDINKILYLDQVSSEENGKFIFKFRMPSDLPSGRYPFAVGSNSMAAVYRGSFLYEGKKEYKKFVNADLNIAIDGYIPTVTGVMSSFDTSHTVFKVTDITDNTVIANELVNAGDGEHTILYTLPSLAEPKKYTADILFVDGTEDLGSVKITIDSSVITVKASGNITVGDDVKLDIQLKSLNTGLIDKSASVTSNKNVDLTIPNVIGNARYNLKVSGYKFQSAVLPESDMDSAEYDITGNAADNVKVYATATNVDDFSDKIFMIEYNPFQITPTDFFGLNKENIIGTGKKGQVNIISYSSGRIVFSIGKEIRENIKWSGVINVFGFKFNDDYSGSSTITLRQALNGIE